jgi:hypothetical protein
MPYYQKRPEIVHAIQIERGMEVDSHLGKQWGNPGDYLVRMPNGNLVVMRQDEFERQYERCCPNPLTIDEIGV